jgi:gliding motility-associated-like protein
LALPGNVVGTPTYLWSNGRTGQIITDICPGTYGVTVTDQLGNSSAAVYTVTAPPALLAQVAVTCASAPGVADGIAIAEISGGVEPYTYAWSNGQTSSTIQDVTAGPYTLSVTDENGCELAHRLDVCIEGIDCYQAITVITPNDDGKNDWFTINCIYDLPNMLSIYNRYGGLEFEMEDYDNSWQGRDQEGNVLSDGGYHWVLQVSYPNGDDKIYSGTVSVIRSLD